MTEPSPETPFRSGFVCLVGRPNVGKSTLMNRLVGSPVSIATAKPQTTRTRIMGVKTGPAHQIVFVDTPGIHQATSALNRRMVGYALAALTDADVVLHLVEPLADPAGALGPEERLVLERVQGAGRPALLVVNKVDAADEARVLGTIARFADLGRYEEVVPLSALTGRNVERLEALLETRLPEGPQYFEAEQLTDQSTGQLVAELVRQQLFERTQQEVPYSSAVSIEQLETRENGTLVVGARIHVERESQKGIVIGKGGRTLKAIGEGARRRIEWLFGCKVYLALHVGVSDRWSTDPRRLDELGYPEG